MSQQEFDKWERVRKRGRSSYRFSQALIWGSLALVFALFPLAFDSDPVEPVQYYQEPTPWYVVGSVFFSVFVGMGYLYSSARWRENEEGYEEFLYPERIFWVI